jgi:anti-sigma regulatory factor (Ser/Thr protein kinase)
VLTDLLMPEMDGLELLRITRQMNPQTPVIVMTAYGNETLAVEALENGAASYVPKSRQAEQLLETVEQILARSQAEKNRARLLQSMTDIHCNFTLENDRALFPPLIDFVQQSMAGIGIGDSNERVRIGLALEEALRNALYHGNLELTADELARARANWYEDELAELIRQRQSQSPYCDRRITVGVRVATEGICLSVRDEGNGFEQSTVNQLSGDHFETGGNRGLILMRSFADEVVFNSSGNEVMLFKHGKLPIE